VTPTEFATVYRSQANAVSIGTGIDPLVLLTQWGVETGWGNQIYNQNNLGNIRCLTSVPCINGFAQFSSLESFVANAIAVWHNGFYSNVLATVGQDAQCLAIGLSPWDAGHYDNGSGPGSSLLAALQLIGGSDVTPEQGDDIIVNAWRTYRLIGGTGSPPVTDLLSDGSTVDSHLDPTAPSLPDVLRAIAEVNTKVEDVAIIKVDIQQFVLAQLSSIAAAIAATPTGGGLTANQTAELTAILTLLNRIFK
jgi:hypothetical protein